MNETLILDRGAAALHDAHGARFVVRERRWVAPTLAAAGRAIDPPGARVSLADAVGWLQRESGHPLRAPIGVIGPRAATAEQLAVAEALGAGLAARGYVVVCGGREGVMEAVCRGVSAKGGVSIGLTPDTDPTLANPYAAIVLATGIGEARNAVIARAAYCLVAVGDSHGTLSEVALGLHFGKRVIGLAGAAQRAGVEHAASTDEALARVDRAVLALG
ncbi:MAG: TIGR00725 family protein [Casimicrobiaceae bacterium]